MKKKTVEQFIEEANCIHNHKFDYSKVVYTNNCTKVKIICPIHGETEQTPNSHLKSEYGCKLCGEDASSVKQRLSKDEIVSRSNIIHNNKYSYCLDGFKNTESKIKITCPKHGEFLQVTNEHLKGKGCPLCKTSKGELKIRKILEDNKIEFVPQKKFDECVGKRRRLPFDFYLPVYNICIEYDGKQHFELIKGWGGEYKLKLTQDSDTIKTNYCKTNNIKLIRITYNESIEDILQSILVQKSMQNY
jgi:hypothetical protein